MYNWINKNFNNSMDDKFTNNKTYKSNFNGNKYVKKFKFFDDISIDLTDLK